jgi:UbiD family decarboxylase
MEAHLWQRIKDVDGYIDLKDVHVPPWGACFAVLVKFTPRLEEQAKSVLMAALSSSYAHPKIAIALDDDIDLTDPRDVFWAVATRVDPAHDLLQIPHARMHSLDPS